MNEISSALVHLQIESNNAIVSLQSTASGHRIPAKFLALYKSTRWLAQLMHVPLHSTTFPGST